MDSKKIISVVVPTYNEEKSVNLMYEEIKRIFSEDLVDYDFELIFSDNCSKDNTRNLLEELASNDKRVKCIFNIKNFGFSRNVFYAIQQGSGECTFLVFGDLQDPPKMLVEFVKEWEQGYKVIVGKKTRSKERWLMYKFRSLFYHIMNTYSEIEQIEHFTGFGLYDRSFIDILGSIQDSTPYLKGIVGEFGANIKTVEYVQEKSNRGYSNFNFWKNYDVAMQGITSYTNFFMRISIFIGAFVGILSMFFAIFIIISKIFNINNYPSGYSSIIVLITFLGSLQLFFIGILGEYVLSINARTMKRPLVVEEKRINFE